MKTLLSLLPASCHTFVPFSAENTLSRVSRAILHRNKRPPSEVFVFQRSQNIKSVYTECKQIFPREHQTSLCYANRQLHSTNNILGAKACEQRGLGALAKSGLTCSLSARLNASNGRTTTYNKTQSLNKSPNS